MRGTLIAIVSAFLPIQSTGAEEIELRCNPISGSADSVVLSIDTSRGIIHAGVDNDRGWFQNGGTARLTQDNKYEAFRTTSVLCEYDLTQYVRISPQTIEWGASGSNIDRCGSDIRYSSTSLAPGEQKISYHYDVDRVSGIFLNNGLRYQCQRLATGSKVEGTGRANRVDRNG
jgi:hypothetical protein